MTCIVGIIDKETIYLGGDSAGTAGYGQSIRKDKKVFIKDNKFIIGFTSSFRMGQLLMADDRFIIREQNNSEDDFHYLINAFILVFLKQKTMKKRVEHF
jgi:20S proteasome alpha/beta subunit